MSYQSWRQDYRRPSQLSVHSQKQAWTNNPYDDQYNRPRRESHRGNRVADSSYNYNQSTAVITQPMPNDRNQEPPPNYLVPSVLACFLCCWIIGIIPIAKSIKAREAWDNGYVDEAYRDAGSAKTWLIVTILVGSIITAFSLLYYFVI